MGDDIPALASERLRRHLAEHDTACTGCGYNLRGVTTVTCPECGRVIEAPSETPPDEPALQCHRCGYPLHGLRKDAAGCPECGATDVRLADYAARTARRERRRAPWLIGTCLILGVLPVLLVIMAMVYPPPFMSSATNARISKMVTPAILMCLGVTALAGLVYLRPRLERAGNGRRTGVRAALLGFGAIALITAAILLR